MWYVRIPFNKISIRQNPLRKIEQIQSKSTPYTKKMYVQVFEKFRYLDFLCNANDKNGFLNTRN